MGMIVSIHSYRGGTGKSNLTANLATAVALTGRKVGIVDTDIQSPGIHILFGLDDKQITRALNDYLYGQCKIEETAYHMTPPEVAAAGGRMYLIPSSLKAGEIAKVLRDMSRLRHDKDLSFAERKLLDQAKGLLIGELSAATGKPRGVMEKDIEAFFVLRGKD